MRLSAAQEVLDGIDDTSAIVEHRVEIATELAADIERLQYQIAQSMKRLQRAFAESGTILTSIVDIGPVCAALIIGHVGDVARFATSGHFASYNGTAPLEASSGERRRHRFNHHGNRQLNYALHIIAVVQLRCGGEWEAICSVAEKLVRTPRRRGTVQRGHGLR